MQGNDIPFEHQMLYILRNYQGIMNSLMKCRLERDRYKKMYHDAEPIITGVRDSNRRIRELDNEITHKLKELEKLNARLKEKSIEVGQKEHQLALLEAQIGKLARTD